MFKELIDFCAYLDKLKAVDRQIYTGDRLENTAEHSWHSAMMCLILSPYAPEGVDVGKAVTMMLIHDIPEIEVGDTSFFDIVNNPEAKKAKEESESIAATRIFEGIPSGGGNVLHEIWREYEEVQTPTARFAHAIDKLQPLISQTLTNGRSLTEKGISELDVWKALFPIKDGCPGIWDETETYARQMLDRWGDYQ